MSYFNKLFGIYAENNNKFLYLFGKKFIFKERVKLSKKDLLVQINKKLDSLINFENDLNRIVQDNISTALIHQKTFLPYKNINSGKNIAIIATGPSAKYYKPLDDAIHIGVNRAYQIETINFKYYFIQDYYAVKPYIEDVINYKPETCEKFFGITCEFERNELNRVIPESCALRANAKRYRTDWAKIPKFKPEFMYDISSNPLCCHGSTVFPAIQFALWTNPQKIYIVGCDCNLSGYFNGKMQESATINGKKAEFDCDFVLKGWKEFKEFKDIYYPETEIISVNPVGLKGLFTDIYTDSYLKSNGES